MRLGAATLAMVFMAGTLAGCSTDPFDADLPRSQYDRYMALRGESRPKTQIDSYGHERPALRDRLTPLDTP